MLSILKTLILRVVAPKVATAVIKTIVVPTDGENKVETAVEVTKKPWYKSNTFRGLAAIFVYATVNLYFGWEIDADTLSNLLNNSGDIFLAAAAIFAGWGRTKVIK